MSLLRICDVCGKLSEKQRSTIGFYQDFGDHWYTVRIMEKHVDWGSYDICSTACLEHFAANPPKSGHAHDEKAAKAHRPDDTLSSSDERNQLIPIAREVWNAPWCNSSWDRWPETKSS